MMYKRILTRIVVYGMYAACLMLYAMLYALFQGSEYDWMSTGSPMDAPVNWGDNGSSNRSVIRGIAVAAAIGMQLLIYANFTRGEPILTIILIGIVFAAFW